MTIDDALAVFFEAAEQERNMHRAPREERQAIIARRDAALRLVHKLENPWQQCRCVLCA